MYNNYEKTYLTGAATTQVATGTCKLIAIVLNTNGGTVGVIDNTSGTTINVGQIASDAPENTYTYNCIMKSGIRIVMEATANATIIWEQL